ncbi:MAG: hypothetical protein KGK06_09505 [Xanthomonadaceae bacterium]|nr:hypothetical protein [Xanthomonadaceae bacterium]
MTDIPIGRSDDTEVNLDPRFGNRQGMLGATSRRAQAIEPPLRPYTLRSRPVGIRRGER